MKEDKILVYGKQHHQVLFIFTNIHSNVRAQTLSKQFFFIKKEILSDGYMNMMNCLKDFISDFFSLYMVEIYESFICLKSSTYIVCRLEKKNCLHLFFFFFLLGIIVTSNRIHIEKKTISLFFLLFSLTRFFFLLLPTQEDFCRNIHFFFFSLFDKALCKLCAFSSNVSLSLSRCVLMLFEKGRWRLSCMLMFTPSLSLSPFFSVVVI